MRDSALALDCFFAVGLVLLIALVIAENKTARVAASIKG